MKASYAATIALALSTLAGGYASAADLSAQARTREQVRAELAEAQRTGDIVADGESGKKRNELYPDQYPATASVPGKTRAQVLAELAEAQRTGDIVADGNSGKKLNELYPHQYPAKPATAGKTRAEVQAELNEALRNGDFVASRIHDGSNH